MNLDRITLPKVRPIMDFCIPVPQKRILKNGIPLHIIHADTEDVVRLDIILKGGRMAQKIPFQALITNRMLREGTVKYTSAIIAEKLDYYGASLELASSVYNDYVTLYSLNKYFPQTLDLVTDIVKHPTFPENELQTIIDANKQQFQIISKKVDMITRKHMNRALFGANHPLGWMQKAEDFDRIHLDVMKEYYQEHYNSSNCSLYLSGKVTPDIIRCVEEQLGYEEWGNTLNKTVYQSYPIKTTTEKYLFIEQKEAVQSALKMCNLSINRYHPDYLKLRVLVVLFGGYFGSRLMKNIREEKGYTYGIEAGLVPNRENSVFIVATEADNEYIPSIIKEVDKEIDCLREEKVSQKELDMVKNYMLGDFCRSYEGPFSLADAWIYIETGNLDDTFYQHSIQTIQDITRDEILRLAQSYLCKENLIAVVAGEKV